jgi:hypothetical protein
VIKVIKLKSSATKRYVTFNIFCKDSVPYGGLSISSILHNFCITNTDVSITHWEKSIVLLTVRAIPAIMICIWNVGVVVTKPAVNTDWKFIPVQK